MVAVPPLDTLAQALPMDDAVRIELREGVPTFRATPKIQERVEELLEKQPEAKLTADESHPEGCCVEVEIDAASLDTGVADRDAHLRGPDFFDAENHPKITFKSRRLEGNFGGEGDRFRAVGDLTMRDQTMEIVLDCEFLGRGKDPWGNERAGFSAHTDLDRREWGLRWNQAIETGGVLVANRVRIDVEVQFVKENQ